MRQPLGIDILNCFGNRFPVACVPLPAIGVFPLDHARNGNGILLRRVIGHQGVEKVLVGNFLVLPRVIGSS